MLDIKVFLIPHSVYIVSKHNIIAICMHLRQAIHFKPFINCVCINNINTSTWIALYSTVNWKFTGCLCCLRREIA
jgi:hypothetical protein